MSYIYFPRRQSSTGEHRFPWPLFLFVSLSLLVIFQWPLQIHRLVDNYNVSEDVAMPGSDGPVVREVLLIALGVMSAFSLARRPADPRMRIDGVMGWLLLAFGVWAIISVLWAQDPSLTIKRLTSFVILCLVAAAVARRLSLRGILLWTFCITSLFLVIAIVAELATGIFQPFVAGYRFSGIQHPNPEAVECAFLAFSGFVAATTETSHKRSFAVVGFVGVIFLVLTASRTTLAATALALAIYFVTVSQRNKAMILPVLGVVGSVVLFLAMTGTFNGLEEKLFPGRDVGGVETFAGRSSVWQDVVPYIRDRPISGYGYGGFWTKKVSEVIADKEDWPVPNAHSTYVDYFLALGAVGGILYVLCLLTGLHRAFSFYRRTRDPHFAFLAGLLLFCMVDGCLESSAGEVTLLSCLTLVALIRLAFLPIHPTREIAAGSRLRNEQFYLPGAHAGNPVA